MKRACLTILVLTLFIPVSSLLYAEGPGDGGPLGIIRPFGAEEPKAGFVKADEAKDKEAKKLSWFEKQLNIIALSEKKNIFYEKSISNIYKRIKDQSEWNKNYTLQRFIEVSKKAEEIGYTVSSYGEHLILQKDNSYIRYFDGRPTDIFNVKEKDNYGNYHTTNTMNISYLDTDQFVVNNDNTTDTHLMEYIKLDYDPMGAINYIKFGDAEYNANIEDRPSAYTTTEGAVEKTSDKELTNPANTKEAKELYDKIVNDIIPAVETEMAYKTMTAFSNMSYYNLSEDNATAAKAGGVYGEKKSYDYSLSTTDAPDAPETGTVSGINYFIFEKIYTDPLDAFWWHAQNASLIDLHHDQEPREASSHTESTRLGITTETDFYGATYNSYNSITGYNQTNKINGTEVGSYHYYDIEYDNYGRQSSYKMDGNSYGLSYSREYSGIKYDTLSRITSYDLKETIDGTTTEYKYWDMTYNNLWQLTDYFYSIDGVEHHRSLVTFNSYGLVESYMDVSVSEGITTTIYRTNVYDTNGLISEYTEQKLRQGDNVKEFYYIWVGNVIYDSIYAVQSFDQVTIKDVNATTITNYYDKIKTILSATTFNGVTYTLNAINMIALGFNTSQFTITTEEWRSLAYYSVGEAKGLNYSNFSLDSFRGRLKSYSELTRTKTTTSDTASKTTL